MNNFLRISVFIYLLFCAFLAPAQVVGQLDLTKLDQQIEAARKQWNIPGMAVAVIKDGKVLMAKGYGTRDVTSGEPVDENSLFAIASNTKAFTVAALSQLVEQGKISWDDPLRKYLPWFELYDPYVSAHLTIRDALCHNSGLGTFSGDLLWYETTYSTREVLERARFLKPQFDFRAGYGYSNLLFAAAGEIIPVVTGKSWAKYIEENFFKPLGMKNSNTSVKLLDSNKNVAEPHAAKPDGSMWPIPYLSWDNCPAAAAINSSVADLSHWIILQLAKGEYNGKKILAPTQMEYVRQIHNSQSVPNSLKGKANFNGYGLGWALFDYYGKKIISHGGGSDGMISKVVMMPDENFGFVILTNSINWLPSALTYSILDQYLGKPDGDYSTRYFTYKQTEDAKDKADYEAARAARVASQPSLPLEAYTGTYTGALYGDAKVSIENGQLVFQFVPAPKLTGILTHWEFNTFEIELLNTPLLPKGKVNFILGMDGKVDEVKVDIPNPDFFFTELEFKKKK